MLWVGGSELRGVGHGDWLKGVEMGVGRIQRCGAVLREELPHWGRPEKVAATLSPLLGSQQPLPQQAGRVTTEKCPSLLPPTRSSPKDFQGLERLPEGSSRLQLPETLLCLVVSPRVSFSLEHFPPTPAAADANTA